LPLLGREVEIAVHLFVVKRANAGCRQAEGFRRDIEPVADSAGFKMHVAVTTITIRADSTAKIADHRKGDACITRQILPKAQTSSSDALVAIPDLLQLTTIGPHSVYTGLQPIDAMSVQIELDEACSGESDENGRLATESIAESCINDIERVPPWKSSAERRLRTLSPKGV